MGDVTFCWQVVNIKHNEGVPFGQGAAVAVVFLRHFYNQHYLAGVVDTGTRFELEYTPDLRPQSLGTFIVQTISLVVPSETLDHHTGVLCPSECTQRNPRFYVKSAAIHMHDRGNSDARKAIIHHVRDGVELAPLLIVDGFKEGTVSESHFQVGVYVEAGDQIHFECIYDNPSSVTEEWGSGWYDQMCVATLYTLSEGGALPVTSCLDMSDGTTDSAAFTAACPSNAQPSLSSLSFTGAQRQAMLALYTLYFILLSSMKHTAA